MRKQDAFYGFLRRALVFIVEKGILIARAEDQLLSLSTVPRGGIRKKLITSVMVCRSVPRGVPSPLFCLHHFFAQCLTLVPRSLLLNHSETIATQAITDRESSVALCHRVVLKKSVGCRQREWCYSVPRGSVKKRIGGNPRNRCCSMP